VVSTLTRTSQLLQRSVFVVLQRPQPDIELETCASIWQIAHCPSNSHSIGWHDILTDNVGLDGKMSLRAGLQSITLDQHTATSISMTCRASRMNFGRQILAIYMYKIQPGMLITGNSSKKVILPALTRCTPGWPSSCACPLLAPVVAAQVP
jgi:hypothetical protein